jgi:hypothetical protein
MLDNNKKLESVGHRGYEHTSQTGYQYRSRTLHHGNWRPRSQAGPTVTPSNTQFNAFEFCFGDRCIRFVTTARLLTHFAVANSADTAMLYSAIRGSADGFYPSQNCTRLASKGDSNKRITSPESGETGSCWESEFLHHNSVGDATRPSADGGVTARRFGFGVGGLQCE